MTKQPVGVLLKEMNESGLVVSPRESIFVMSLLLNSREFIKGLSLLLGWGSSILKSTLIPN